MGKKPLYQDDKIKIDYFSRSPEEHILYLNHDGEQGEHIIQRGVLEELAKTPRGGIERKIANFDPFLLNELKSIELSVNGLHVAFCQAYIEVEKRNKEYWSSKPF